MKKITLILLLFSVSILAQEASYKIKNVSSNTKYQDFGVSYYGENTAVFASSRKDKSIRKRVWLINNQPFLELYKGSIGETGDITGVKRFSKVLNTKFHESNVTFTKDLNTVYFTRDNYVNKRVKKDTTGMILNQLYKAQVGEDGEWTSIEPMPFNSDNYQTGHPVLNAAEDKLYFVSDMPGGYGVTDIYVVEIKSDGTFGEPQNLGASVNTSKSEMFPFIDQNNILYYASNGFADTKGGLDVYATKLGKNNSYHEPQNLGFPINSNRDDFSFVKKQGSKTGYFSSNRPGGKGDDDIYSFEELAPVSFACTQVIAGVARDKNSGALLPGTLVSLYKGEEKVESSIVGTDAIFSFRVACEATYKVVGTKENYKEDFKGVVTTDKDDLKLDVSLHLEQADFITVRGHLMININPIYFDLDKSEIRDDAAIELGRVVEIMIKYPGLVVQIGSHTDSRAPDSYNWALSNRRAISTTGWIVKKGIDKNRIFGGGYGETELVNRCSNGVKCTDEEHQLNRRTEFIIVNPGVVK
ncbi:MAG: OmpA family protein [Lutibacter sp.]|uniref:OmpA family protein n=1 Tax=Lutibacter sp. TaxID=1925666 RepID=UPI0019E1002F|nr:OmpA family protein [Lutibacter sp.]NOR28617.1 OmpA family protein [Lutibacter sp.]